MIYYVWLLLCLCVGTSNGVPKLVFPNAKITVRVVDESGVSIAGANVGIGFSQGGNAWNGEHKSKNITGLSDSNGLFSAQAECDGGIGIGVDKKDHYKSFVRQDYPGTYQNKTRWEPWNPVVEVVLKEKRNPIPLYSRRAKITIPVEDKAVGFDLERGDWVTPYGMGRRKDFLFTFSRNYKSADDYSATLVLKFSSQEDGIQKINAVPVSWLSLRLPHKAPDLGYSSAKVWEMGCVPETGSYGFENPDGDVNYFFRVRTEMSDVEGIKEACYGKIYGPIRVVGIGRDKSQVEFQYYFNPTPNDRNLEFDPQKNLFKKLPPSEQVHEP